MGTLLASRVFVLAFFGRGVGRWGDGDEGWGVVGGLGCVRVFLHRDVFNIVNNV